MDFIITILIGVIVGVGFSIWLTNNKIINLIISIISAGMFFIIPTLVGSVCLTLLVLFIIQTSKDIVIN
ncbi:hypothetical protein AABD40_01060 [Staphylococcus shinii]|jgi:hypothetical protein|uniref:hypothetical protein n=1 Tax=Staphylococcus shinii TaxID=2912228 RepID=UPI00298EDFF9|nr:hypothetical protein [Staphylococcus shinii]MDW8569964.1 hypothetical protein [Staphylococcus shinii]MDW8574133.1 hypothetical protein [Staphylococcus shinii]